MKHHSLLIFLLFLASSSFAQKSQNEEIGALNSGNFQVHKVVDKGSQTFKFETASKPWPVEFQKTDNAVTYILIKRAGIIDEKYEADLPSYPAYYGTKASEIVITVIDKKIYYYSWSVKTGAKISYILSEKSPNKYEYEKATLDGYRRDVLENQSGARQERIEENNELAAQELAENTLDGKEIKSIDLKFVSQPLEIGMLSMVSIGIEVQLADGTILKTKNLGGKTPYSDFEFDVKGGVYAGGDFKVANDASQIPNDKIEITAWSKYDSKKLTGQFSHPLNYKSDIFYQYQGKSGATGRGMTVGYSVHGGDGTNGRSVSVIAVQKTINGESINEITISDTYSGDLIAKAKLHIDNQITINVNGGNGGNGESGTSNYGGDGGNGGNGGDAGSVLLTGSGANSLKITVLSKGGKAGAGGKGKTSSNTSGTNGYSGSDGNFIK